MKIEEGGGSRSGIEKTGVHFMHHKPAEFNALTQSQKTELIEYRAANGSTDPRKSGGGGRGGANKKQRGGGGVNGGGNHGGSVASRQKNQARQKAAAQVAAITEKVVERLAGKDDPADATNGGAKNHIMVLLEKDSSALKTGEVLHQRRLRPRLRSRCRWSRPTRPR